MTLRTYIECPYCDFKQRVTTEAEYDTQLQTCNVEEGGCDRKFVVDTSAHLKAEVFKIQGQMKDEA